MYIYPNLQNKDTIGLSPTVILKICYGALWFVKTYKKPVGIFHQQQLSWFGEMTNNMSSTGEGVENTNFIKMLVFLLVVLPFKFELQADGFT
jgi:hypothetical protein